MTTKTKPIFRRFFVALTILTILVMALPQQVSAAYPEFDVINVKADESVTIRTYNFPANVRFIVRMDTFGNRAENGIAVAEFNSGNGGAFEATIPIPTQLKGTSSIAIRVDGTGGYFAYSWFTNRTGAYQPQPKPTVQPTKPPIPVTGSKPYITFTGVKANEAVTVEARNLPANTTFNVRIGPYYTFFRDYVTAPSIKSDANGYALFTITMPSVVQNAEMITVRIDGGGRYAFNAFKNITGGTVGGGGSIPVTSGSCTIVSTAPTGTVARGADLDMVWEVKNTSKKNWEASSVDYKYVSGSKFYKRVDRYDLKQTVKPGETVRIVVDVIAPQTAGSYTTNWALVEGSTTLCNLSYTLRVR
jgi:hypothetical protein